MCGGKLVLVGPDEILKFWLDDVDQKQWYIQDDDLDRKIVEKFEATWNEAMEGSWGLWLTYPSGALAYIILTDQFPRNMFRDSAKAFSSDKMALAVAKQAIHRGWDLKIDEPARQFFYLPLMHSENLCDQERCIRLMKERMPETGESNLIHAKAHREVIRLFGRFPYRNEALDRQMTESEQAYVDEGGYGSTLRALQSA
ncbi:Uncharacterized conserved protein, DUF924 family [Thalassococcus halodurans]|jgi:uncharacterized protein (DUF924 family)|uniref:Uncharacterized conserved protein, DUF924 family n=1 Tax=Thalassococcus halodurans TaxID=373675 RepID=A0A1H5WCF6_9RHOB|nr:Uncharacterized conserved protein, DUF924 family [Thalassococcus halodurans]